MSYWHAYITFVYVVVHIIVLTKPNYIFFVLDLLLIRFKLTRFKSSSLANEINTYKSMIVSNVLIHKYLFLYEMISCDNCVVISLPDFM